MSYSHNQIFRIADNISITTIDDESVVLDLNSGSYYGLNHVGTMLLSELRQAHSLGQAIEEISRHYQIQSSIVKHDSLKLLEQMIEQNILTASQASNT